ncbi:peptidoglycan DD-metalloendopeptidase family protein [Rhodococcus hoagii]|nr:peptidoglycan DD-metalloendopeptidase family protein [Prescottella equi]
MPPAPARPPPRSSGPPRSPFPLPPDAAVATASPPRPPPSRPGSGHRSGRRRSGRRRTGRGQRTVAGFRSFRGRPRRGRIRRHHRDSPGSTVQQCRADDLHQFRPAGTRPREPDGSEPVLQPAGQGPAFQRGARRREAAAAAPLFVLPAKGTYTSSFGARWGTLHAGVDIANAIGTRSTRWPTARSSTPVRPPASACGVRLQHADGTITVYGHINETLVTVGQKVMAGDQIATMGNRGFSTGPHLHFEVHLAGENKIDPLPWLATRGISLGVEQP